MNIIRDDGRIINAEEERIGFMASSYVYTVDIKTLYYYTDKYLAIGETPLVVIAGKYDIYEKRKVIYYVIDDLMLRDVGSIAYRGIDRSSGEYIDHLIYEEYIIYDNKDSFGITYIIPKGYEYEDVDICIEYIGYDTNRQYLHSRIIEAPKDIIDIILENKKCRKKYSIRNSNEWSGCTNKQSFGLATGGEDWKDFIEIRDSLYHILELTPSIKKLCISENIEKIQTSQHPDDNVFIPIVISYRKSMDISFMLATLCKTIDCFFDSDGNICMLISACKDYICQIGILYVQNKTICDQYNVKTFLEQYHPLYILQKEIDVLEKDYMCIRVVQNANAYIDAKQAIHDYRMQEIKVMEELAEKSKGEAFYHKWKNEYLLYLYVKMVFPDAIYQYRSDWLENQSLDIYVPSLNVGFEYQGEQHEIENDFFGGKAGLEENNRRDRLKMEKCRKNKTRLFEWRWTKKLNKPNFVTFIKKYYPEIDVEQKLDENIKQTLSWSAN